MTNPRALYQAGGVRDLTASQRARIDAGEDIVRVFNEGRDRWREQMAVLRREARRTPGRQVSPEDFMGDLVSQVAARRAMRAAGFIAD